MDAATLKAAMDRMGWGVTALAQHIGYRPQGVDQWLSGRVRVPCSVAVWLRSADAWLAANPPPKKGKPP
jgi:DNA-binding transcriptional regulator YdaS (Cro superfamily)